MKKGMISIIFFDFETYKYDWTVSYLDTRTRKIETIINDKLALEKLYKKNKNEIWVGFNNRHFDNYIFQGILAGFNPYEITDWIINKDRGGWEFSSLLRNYPLITYDTMIGFRGLKELECFMGIDIKETSVPFNLDRPLTKEELEEVKVYNQHDVKATFLVFLELKEEFESHLSLIKEFDLPMWMLSKTKSQISAEILNARQPARPRDDEFDIYFVDNLQLGKYEYVKDHYANWAKNIRDYDKIELKTTIANVPTVISGGGIHGNLDGTLDTGNFILSDIGSFYPALMIEHGFLSRNVSNPEKFKEIRDDRYELKAKGDPREYPRKIILNSTYGSTKYKFSKLYDPLMANLICFNGQLLLIDLIEKLEDLVTIININTDGILYKVHNKEDEPKVFEICKEWQTRHKFTLSHDRFNKVVIRDVNNYLFIGDNWIDRGGAVVKKLSKLDNDLPIVNRAVVDYFTKGISPRETIYGSNELIDFQKITKISSKYDFGFHENGSGVDVYQYQVPKYRTRKGEKYLSHYEDLEFRGDKLQEKVIRCFASTNPSDGAIYKKHKDKITLDKTASTPDNAFIDNGDITEKGIPSKLDRGWYVELSERRIREFVK